MKRRHPQIIDVEATAAAGFTDPRSYIRRGQTFLFGDDMTQLRRRVFDRSRGRCEMPMGGYTTGIRCGQSISWETMELDHNPSLSQGGDDTEEGCRALCKKCHLARHNRSVKSDRAKK